MTIQKYFIWNSHHVVSVLWNSRFSIAKIVSYEILQKSCQCESNQIKCELWIEFNILNGNMRKRHVWRARFIWLYEQQTTIKKINMLWLSISLAQKHTNPKQTRMCYNLNAVWHLFIKQRSIYEKFNRWLNGWMDE